MKLLKRVLAQEDWIVYLVNKEPWTFRYILVRVRNGIVKVVGGPYKVTYLVMPNEIPALAKEALEKADQCELLALDPTKRSLQESKTDFHGWRIIGKTIVKDGKKRKQLLTALKVAALESEGLPAACFNPRHGLRLVHNGRTIDLVICFECLVVKVYPALDWEKGFYITDSPRNLFEGVLREAHIERVGPLD